MKIVSSSLKILAPGTQPAAHTAPTGSVVQCNTQVYKNGPVYVTSVRNLSCEAAAGEQRRYKWTGKTDVPYAWRVPVHALRRGAVGFQIRCAKGSASTESSSRAERNALCPGECGSTF